MKSGSEELKFLFANILHLFKKRAGFQPYTVNFI